MNYPLYFDSKNSFNLFEMEDYFWLISNLYLKNNLPKVLMFSGKKGEGKATLINHFLYSIFDTKNYNKEKFLISENSLLLKQFHDNIYPNIIYVRGADFVSVKIEDIRILKKKILKSTISNGDRFIIFDDVELVNHNSLNALLKLIETIKSRSLEIKLILNEKKRLEIIKKLTSLYQIQPFLNPKISQLSPGNYLKYNHLCNEFQIDPIDNYENNLTLLLNLYKKNKDITYIHLVLFITDYYLKNLGDKKLFKIDEIYEIKNYIFKNLNNYVMYNLNQNSLIAAVNRKLNYG
jgi:hypothetical protein